jgi:hypothetical protein
MNSLVSDNTICEHNTVSLQKECWHGPCTIKLHYRDGSVWVRNEHGSGRRLPIDRFRERNQ